MTAPTATISGRIAQDAFHFDLVLGYQGATQTSPFILDTGAFELTLTQSTANSLGLPNLGSLSISGVTGSAPAYTSVVDLTLGATTYNSVPCVVDPSLQSGQLFGLRFFIDNSLELTLNTVDQTLTVAGAGAPSTGPAPGPGAGPGSEAYIIEFTDKASADGFLVWADSQGFSAVKKPIPRS